MQATLNLSKKDNDICGISQRFYFTFQDPGPVEIDFNDLTEVEKRQFYASWKAGKLLLENAEKLEWEIEVKGKVNNPITEHQLAQAKSHYKPVDERVLKKLRRQKVSEVKKAISTLNLKELKVLHRLETEAVNTRPSIAKMLGDLIDKHTAKVIAGLDGAAEELMFNTSIKHVSGQLSVQQYLDSIGDVVESNVEEVTIQLGAKDSEE